MCRLCDTISVEDEHHVLLDCPAYASLRSEFQVPSGEMKTVMLSFDQSRLALFLDRAWALRNNTEPFGR